MGVNPPAMLSVWEDRFRKNISQNLGKYMVNTPYDGFALLGTNIAPKNGGFQ